MDLKNIVVIGPVYPYKGGISHYTGLLYQALAKRYNVCMVSYKMQYPKFLYKKEQKDYSNDAFQIQDTKYWLNTADPLNIINTANKVNKLRPDLVIIQWWHPYFAPCYWLLTHLLRRSRIMFVCHNVFPHERFPADKLLTKMALKKGDLYITNSKSDAEDLIKIKKDAKYQRAVHPTYNTFRIKDLSYNQARDMLGIGENERILLFFGFVRPYKGLKYLLEAMPIIKGQLERVRLWVVGDFGEDEKDYFDLINRLKIGADVELVKGYIPDEEVEKYFSAADLVVLPYESATQSGIVQIAYGFEKPVVATNVGGLPEVVLEGRTGFLAAPKDPASLADKVVTFFKQGKQREFSDNIKKESYKYSWDRMIEIIENLWKR